jgi:hypothetical protein
MLIIELDDGKIYRKALYLMVKTMVSCRFPLNQSNELRIPSFNDRFSYVSMGWNDGRISLQVAGSPWKAIISQGKP